MVASLSGDLHERLDGLHSVHGIKERSRNVPAAENTESDMGDDGGECEIGELVGEHGGGMRSRLPGSMTSH